jgi:acetolactate synthase small subunit
MTPDAAREAEVSVLNATLHHRPGALDRLVGLLRRHGCVVMELRFQAGRLPAEDDVQVTFAGGQPSRVVQQARRLVDVIRADEG